MPPVTAEAWLRDTGRSPQRSSLLPFALMLALLSCLPAFGVVNGVTTRGRLQ